MPVESASGASTRAPAAPGKDTAAPGFRFARFAVVGAAPENTAAQPVLGHEAVNRLAYFAGRLLASWPECLYDLDGAMQQHLRAAGLIEHYVVTEADDPEDFPDADPGDTVLVLSALGRTIHQEFAAYRAERKHAR